MKHWKIKEVKPIHEAGVTLSHVIHEGCGAEVIHLAADDEENVFALTFKTYPQDDTGVAHILEHTTLCGSKAYPIHDPFFSMLRRSTRYLRSAQR